MTSSLPEGILSIENALAELERLRQFSGSPAEFWKSYLAAVGSIAGSSRALLIVRDSKQPGRLKKLGDWSNNGHADPVTQSFHAILTELTEKACEHGKWKQPLDQQRSGNAKAFALAVQIPLLGTQDSCALALLLPNTTEAQADETLVRARLAADVPFAFQTQEAARRAKLDGERFAAVLDLMTVVNSEHRFLAAAMAFCNVLASRFQCDRVSLGWLTDGFVRLKAMSRTERFDKNMSAVLALEMVMEECLDQNAEISWPVPDGFGFIAKDHEKFVQEQASANICSIPLRKGDAPVAVLTCERRSAPFSPAELEQFRLACDQAVSRLMDLHQRDRWFGARWKMRAREIFARVIGPEHTWAKLFAVLGCVAVVICSVPMFTYKVEGKFILRSDEVSFLTAPFDGFIRSVDARPGDAVTNGTVLLRMSTDELVLQEAAAISEQARYLREMEKARAANSLAEMRIAQALTDQAKARLELIRYRLDQSSIKATFTGAIVEGDLRQRIGAPVKQGDAFFKVARTDALYAEVEVNERDIHEILAQRDAQIAFVAQPKLKFPVHVTRIEEAAFPKDRENVFLVRCALTGPAESWWRPGMSGICKLPVEKRSLFWIAAHRTVDFLRMFFWW